MLWIHVPSERTAEGLSQEQAVLQGVIEKKTMINLIQAYSVSIKAANDEDKLPLWSASDEIEQARIRRHQLRHPDKVAPQGAPVRPALTRDDTLVSRPSWIRSFSKGGHVSNRQKKFDPEKVLPEVDSNHPLKPARSPPVETVFDTFPILRILKWVVRKLLLRAEPEEELEERRMRHKMQQESNVPLEICMDVFTVPSCSYKQLYRPPWASTHEILLQFQIYNPFGYFTIPGTAFTSFLLLGFLEIGQEM
ncbi:hypothetical protein DXG03_002746 [Asterophora parasitica]|uniref:Uncharacterized protein n=1 Tax=Asterophora parasitica TaxID=117018 RepID=A0A9P7G5G1_9AGAR|nr:hypothetical protein DXG03_002746 [Asterophora parasitica]